MNDGKDRNREIIHRLLDGDASPEEQQALMDRVMADRALKDEFDGLTKALHAVAASGRKPAPPFFTAEVMRRLSPRSAGFAGRVRDFLFRGRMLQWNMATALATAGVVVVAVALAVRVSHPPVETASVQQQERVAAVTMNFYAPEARHVAVAGTFNKWKVDANVLTKQENGLWTISIPLKPGVYTYMFIVDGKAWVTDPNAESYRDDGFGYKNSVMRVNL